VPTNVTSNFQILTNAPLDGRTVFDTLEEAKARLHRSVRYEGLSVYIKEEQREYRFVGGIENTDLIAAGDGGGATGSYNDLVNKPALDGTTLVQGSTKTALDIASKSALDALEVIVDDLINNQPQDGIYWDVINE
jgi:hypothetical protein